MAPVPESTPLPFPSTWSSYARRLFRDLANSLTAEVSELSIASVHHKALRSSVPGLSAATHVLCDLSAQGWKVTLDSRRIVTVQPPSVEIDPVAEKARVQRQELIKRDEQLALPSVQRFVRDMERPREFRGAFISIFNLMRDGRCLAAALEAAQHAGLDLRSAIDPYVQVIRHQERCEHTGLRLVDIWRYFRHTWSNQYTTTPGRTLLVLVRDRAVAFHPVIGIAAIGSAVVQIRERDEWIGWQTEQVLARLSSEPTTSMARWLQSRLEKSRDELYVDDLIRDRLYWPALWRTPKRGSIDSLLEEARHSRRKHHRFVDRSDFKWSEGTASWKVRAESQLFRSRRCVLLADLLAARLALLPHFGDRPTARALSTALADRTARHAIAGIIRRAKGEAVGTEIADLMVCGAVAPYAEILGGKLVSMLAVSPTIVRAYHDRYSAYASEIASALAGRRISRPSHLAYIGTTSLYGSGSSQYNRLRIPSGVLGGGHDLTFCELGKSRSFGTSHFSDSTVKALVELAQGSRTGTRVNNIFGEGVNPKLRKVRDGLDMLGWPSDHLLRHHRPRIVYGVSLVNNLLPYLLGLEARPVYIFDTTIRDDVDRIAEYWRHRWLEGRVASADVLCRVRMHSLERPVRHGARVRPAPTPQGDTSDSDA